MSVGYRRYQLKVDTIPGGCVRVPDTRVLKPGDVFWFNEYALTRDPVAKFRRPPQGSRQIEVMVEKVDENLLFVSRL